MPETETPRRPPRRPLAGLLTAQFFGAFNDNAMKLMVALLLGEVATRTLTDEPGASEMARQEQTTFAFERHRRIEHYSLITERVGAVPPPE